MQAGPVPRRVHIDWARGVAVLIMVGAHTLDAWTRVADRATPPFAWWSLLGGFAAPLFLFLAGLALVLAAEQQLLRGRTRASAAEAIVKRGAEIFILAFLFRLQAFIISPGSWLITLFRVDILNVMGPSIAAAGVLWWLAPGRIAAVALGALAAAAIAMVTPIVRAAPWVEALPLWCQWYLRPFAEQTTFTLLPWSGFVFAGTAFGAAVAGAATPRADRRLGLTTVLAGGALIAVGFWTASRPSIYAASSFWTSSPTFFLIRVGVMLLFVTALWALTLPAWLPTRRWLGFLETFGRNSLFIYWIHVELVYGYLSWGIHRRLPLWGTAVGFLLFTFLMYGAIHLRDALSLRWKPRLAGAPSPVAG